MEALPAADTQAAPQAQKKNDNKVIVIDDSSDDEDAVQLVTVTAAKSVRPIDERPWECPPRLGLAELITVSCDRRQQVYCQLCSVRLKHSSHVSSLGHLYNYVKKKYPGLTVKPPSRRTNVRRIAARLAKVEKDTEPSNIQRVTVTKDEYERLAWLPEDTAVETLKAMMSQRDSSSSTVHAAETTRREVAFTTACQASSSGNGTSRSPPSSRPEQEDTEQQQQVQDDEQRHSSLVDSDALQEQCFGSEVEVQAAGVSLSKPHGSTETLTESTRLFIQSAGSPDLEQQQQLQQWTGDVLTVGQVTTECSHLSGYLRIKGLDAEPIIGLGSVWECRGVCLQPFFLCESCREKLSAQDICQHMVSQSHRFNYMVKQDCPFLWFWSREDMTLQNKAQLLRDVTSWLSEQERSSHTDAQSVLMHAELHQQVQRASFSEALAVVKIIRRRRSVTVTVPSRAPN